MVLKVTFPYSDQRREFNNGSIAGERLRELLGGQNKVIEEIHTSPDSSRVVIAQPINGDRGGLDRELIVRTLVGQPTIEVGQRLRFPGSICTEVRLPEGSGAIIDGFIFTHED